MIYGDQNLLADVCAYSWYTGKNERKFEKQNEEKSRSLMGFGHLNQGGCHVGLAWKLYWNISNHVNFSYYIH